MEKKYDQIIERGLIQTAMCKDGILGKSFHDPYKYKIRLITGDMVEYTLADELLGGEYIHLSGVEGYKRGITVRRDAIVWCIDLGD